jgi:DNA-binding MarR family transcriptional regulator
MPLMQLASLMAVTPSSITNRVDRLVERGLVERHLSPTDRRSWLVRLLPEGRRIVDELIPKHMERERQLLSALSDQEREQLRNLLGKIIAGVEQRETSR